MQLILKNWSDKMFCGKCGTKVEQDAKFCNKCGHQNGHPAQQTNMQPFNQQPSTEKKGLNLFVWFGFGMDLIGFLIAINGEFTAGIVVMVLGLVLSIIGLVKCIEQKGDAKTAGLFVFLDIAFLIGIVIFRNWF